MKVLQILFLLLCIFTIKCLSMTVFQYVKGQRLNIERTYSPITPEMCRKYRKYSKLRSCKLVRNNPNMLNDYSKEYFTLVNLWKSVTNQNKKGIGNLEVASMLIKKFTESQFRRNDRDDDDDDRRKRSLSTEVAEENVAHKRVKRRISGNPCVHGRAVRTTIIYAIDSETGEVVELYQDPNNLLFQTFYTKKCFRGKVYGMRCMPQYIEFQSPVYKGNTYEIILRYVKIPTSCAMSFS